MARLIEPDGTIGLIVTIEYAMRWCASYPAWTWEYYDPQTP